MPSWSSMTAGTSTNAIATNAVELNTVSQSIATSHEPLTKRSTPTKKSTHLSSPATPRSTPVPVPTPSSSLNGFFQTPPPIPNQFHDDVALTRALHLFIPTPVLKSLTPSLSVFGAKVLTPQIQSWILDAERNSPYVKSHDTWGRRRDDLVTSEGWRNLQALGIAEGMVSTPYENMQAEYSRVYHFAKYHLWAASAAWVNCPSLMVDGVASLLRKHLSDPKSLGREQAVVLRSAYDRLTSSDPGIAWTTGQWMTERQGGSDVSKTETLATYSPIAGSREASIVKASDGNPLGPWSLSGFKWFSSATDANMMVLLAQTPKDKPKGGLSLFFAPMRKTLPEPDVLGNDTVLNGVTIQRLKNKLGTRALPTAELELKDVRAWLIGEEGKGTKEMATVLNVARVHNGVTAIGFWGRGLGVVRAFTKVRIVGGRPLWERSSFMRTLARMHAEYRADVLFNFFVAGLLGVVEQEHIRAFTGASTPGAGTAREGDDGLGQIPGLKSLVMASDLLRLLTPALKGHCSKTAIAGLQECMECMGGVGYLENDDMQYNIARLYRDANVLPIWEGTTDMMADDSVLRVLFGKKVEERNKVWGNLDGWVEGMVESMGESRSRFGIQAGVVRGWWSDLRAMLSEMSRDEAELNARAIMERLVDIVQGSLLVADALSDEDEVAGLVVEAWFKEKDGGRKMRLRTEGTGDWQGRVQADLKIVFGVDGPGAGIGSSTVKSRL